jgi:hypothetical protein
MAKPGRPRTTARERKAAFLFARVAPDVANAFTRYAEEIHGKNSSAVLRLLVEQTLFNAGRLPKHVRHISV